MADCLRGHEGTIGERLERDPAAFQTPLPAQNLHELALTLLIHPGFQKAPQRHELFRQPPAGQRRGLI
jgi:hypothetical protein